MIIGYLDIIVHEVSIQSFNIFTLLDHFFLND